MNIFLIVGMLLGCFLSYIFARWLAYENSKQGAGRTLRKSFGNACFTLYVEENNLQQLIDGENCTPYDDKFSAVVINDFEKCYSAVREYQHYLSRKEKEDFLCAWQKYSSDFKNHIFFHERFDDNGHATFKKSVSDILVFTKTGIIPVPLKTILTCKTKKDTP